MPVNWMDVSKCSFNVLLLLERVQLSWMPGWVPARDLAFALHGNPEVLWYMRHKCPDLNGWLDRILAENADVEGPEDVRSAEINVLKTINDWVVYAVEPAIYDAQPFLGWDSNELLSVVDFGGKTVIDVGAGTGRLTFLAAKTADAVFSVEPVGNLRCHLRGVASDRGCSNVYTVDGLITEIPFPDGFADVTMGGHVYGDEPGPEYREMERVTKDGGMIVLCPGNDDSDSPAHRYLVVQGFEWSRFEEPGDGGGMVRKYWKTV